MVAANRQGLMCHGNRLATRADRLHRRAVAAFVRGGGVMGRGSDEVAPDRTKQGKTNEPTWAKR
jgi:hypothetical protein